MVEKQSSTDKPQMKQIFGKMPRIILTDIFADQVSYFGNLVSDFGEYQSGIQHCHTWNSNDSSIYEFY